MTSAPSKTAPTATPKAKATTTGPVVEKKQAKPAPAKAVKPVAKAAVPATIVREIKKKISKNDKTPVSKSTSKPVKTETPVKPVGAAKLKKIKMVRDSMSMPKDEYAVLDTLKIRATKLGKPVKKTEILRAGIKALAAMTDAAYSAALHAVPNLKTGRPLKSE